MSIKRTGFTLVELLIVIVVVGILAAMMMLSSTEAVASSKAAKIIADMKNIKTAATMWYLDNTEMINVNGSNNSEKYAIVVTRNSNGKVTAYDDVQTYLSGYGKKVAARQKEFRKYLDGSSVLRINVSNLFKAYGTEKPGDYALINNKNITNETPYDKDWYISCRIADKDTENLALQSKLQAKAASLGLVGTDGKTYTGGRFVFMHVIRFGD